LATTVADNRRVALFADWLNDTSSQLVEVVVEISITAADWLANFSD